ncbi:MAG: hypothetical protein CML13_10395 [Puniceicoccaceae bacterium]|nr:hypothetical protein [Puniceicoccaceae bacterium]|tara:strand:- start:37357 stop:40095 length:2739 start_codon:yes stop_codon:yes gene_type:complete
MALLRKLRLSLLLELFLDTGLLLLFIAQALIVGCLIIYGHLPLPSEWAQQSLAQKLPSGLQVEADEFRVQLDGSLKLLGVKVRTKTIQQNLLEADSLELALKWQGFKQLPAPTSLTVTGGTLYIPSVYSPDGYHSRLLERIAFRLAPEEGNWSIERFAARHDQIHLRGSFQTQATASSSKQPSARLLQLKLQEIDLSEHIQTFYQQVAKLSQYKQRINFFKNPTLSFKFKLIDAQHQEIDLHLSSRLLQHPEVQAEQVQLKAHIQLQGDQIRPLSAPRLTATQLEIPRYQIHTKSLSAEFPPVELSGALAGQWPPVNLAAEQIKLQDFELDAPTLQIDPAHYPELTFHGSTRSLDGAIDLSGQVNAQSRSGHVRARGSVDLSILSPEALHARLPDISYETPPYLDLQIDLAPGFALKQAELEAQVNDLQIDQISFDHIKAHASYQSGQFEIRKLSLQRQRQWLDLKFKLNTQSKDYKLTLLGSAVPYEYNALLPRWWAAIFKDFDFSHTDYSLGDFIIYGNSQRKAADLYYGHAEAHNAMYSDIAFDEAELIVRGRGPYCELRNIRTRSGPGWAKGNLAFSSRMGDGKGPISLRIDMTAKLTLEDAAKIFKGNVAQIIADFQTEDLPITRFEGAIFNSQYPEYADQTYFDLTAKLGSPLTFKGVPLDYLSFDLYGRSTLTQLRQVELGYADGQGLAQIDIHTPKSGASTLNYQFTLQDAEQNQAIQSLPQLDNLETKLQSTSSNSSQPSAREPARIDLQLNGQGPAEDPLRHAGLGQIEIRNEQLGTIQLLGPLSKILQNTQFNFTSFNLNLLRGNFHYQNQLVTFDPLRIDGTRTQITALGSLNLSNQALNMRLKLSLFGNFGKPDSNIKKISELITKPLTNLLEFELTGTPDQQKIRSLYDPRNLIPLFE